MSESHTASRTPEPLDDQASQTHPETMQDTAPDSPGSRRATGIARMVRWPGAPVYGGLAWAIAVGLSLCVLILSFPDLLPGSRATTFRPFAQLVAMRGPMAAGWILVGIILGLTSRARAARFKGGRRTTLVAVVVLTVAAVQIGGLAQRGLGGSADAFTMADTSRGTLADGSTWDGTVTVYALNVLYSRADATVLAEQVADSRADVVVLSEASAGYGAEAAALLAEKGLHFTVHTAGTVSHTVTSVASTSPDAPASGATHRSDPTRASLADPSATTSSQCKQASGVYDTTVLMSTALGDYEAQFVPGLGRGAALLRPAGEPSLDGHLRPTVLGVHTFPPVSHLMSQWRSSVTGVVRQCRAGVIEPGLILAGDLNATADHAVLRDLGGCADAGEQAGIGGLATWPTTSRTPLLGATIDHVLVDQQTWTAQAGAVMEVPGTDHRAVVVTLVPVNG